MSKTHPVKSRKLKLRRTHPGPKTRRRSKKTTHAHHRIVIAPTVSGGIFNSDETSPKAVTTHQLTSKSQNRNIVIAIMVLIILVGWLVVSRDRKNPIVVQQVIDSTLLNGCSQGTEDLEEAYEMSSETKQQAEIAALISQCASVGFKDIPKAIKYARQAGELFAKIGDQTNAKKHFDYANQFDQLLKNPPPSRTSAEDKGEL